jgi:hypothetical protein
MPHGGKLGTPINIMDGRSQDWCFAPSALSGSGLTMPGALLKPARRVPFGCAT